MFRVRSVSTQAGYISSRVITMGMRTETPTEVDLADLAYNTGQINDTNSDTSATSIPGWQLRRLSVRPRGRDLVSRDLHAQRLVDPEPCELAGPRMVFVQGCAGRSG